MSGFLDYIAGADLVTEKAVVLMQDRAVIGLSTWLLDAALAAEKANRELQFVTPPTSRVTHAVRTQLLVSGTRWVVQADSPYDGLTGVPLAWDGELFVPTAEPGKPRPSQHWLASPDIVHANLQIVARVRHAAVESAVVGGATEFLFRELAGGPPAGWGTEEPVSQPWDTREVTRFCRRWAPRSTLLTVAGEGPASGVIDIDVRPAGLEETATIAIGYQGMEAPLPEALFPAVSELAERFEVVSMFMLGVGGSADACLLPRFTGVADPVALVIGQDGRAAMGPEAAKAVEAGVATSIGHDTALWFPIGTGYCAPDWETFSTTMRRITIATAHHSGEQSTQKVEFTMPD